MAMYFCSVCDKTYEDIQEAMDCCMDKIHKDQCVVRLNSANGVNKNKTFLIMEDEK